jgi:hypothetical protein
MKAVFDHNYVKKIDGPNVKKGKEQAGSGRAAAPGHPRLPEVEWREPPDHHLVRFDRDLH